MKKFFLAFMACVMCMLTACEEHDGTKYFKTKCIAELNDRSLVDQTLFSLSPDAIVTPELTYWGNALNFMTLLRADRKGEILYAVHINLYAGEADVLLTKEQKIEKINLEFPDGQPSYTDYVRYCIDNKISYAMINDEPAERGTFRITSYDLAKRSYHGTFTLTFSEGTLTGHFEI